MPTLEVLIAHMEHWNDDVASAAAGSVFSALHHEEVPRTTHRANVQEAKLKLVAKGDLFVSHKLDF